MSECVRACVRVVLAARELYLTPDRFELRWQCCLLASTTWHHGRAEAGPATCSCSSANHSWPFSMNLDLQPAGRTTSRQRPEDDGQDGQDGSRTLLLHSPRYSRKLADVWCQPWPSGVLHDRLQSQSKDDLCRTSAPWVWSECQASLARLEHDSSPVPSYSNCDRCVCQ